ncbi:MAG: acyltransferase family protein [Pseudomonadota bacterium]|nr:acyltransferase family protein [Pseudomonadota bacterium]MEC8665393.1 acyltransferase family protein [Pseudomonadota bacterium]
MKYRAEIDGLRALAVLPVILFHAGFDMFSGGYVGVDVFFVISGYLITTIIVNELENKRFSLLGFYERRARRILPALCLVVLVTIPFAWMWLTPKDMKDFAQSVLAVGTFSSNILFWRESGYFESAAELKPLLHTWSLAVEEQYYILFPLFLMLCWKLGAALRHRVLIGLLVLIFIGSLAIGHWGAIHKPAAAFFLLPTRGWELLLGAFCALYLRKREIQTGALTNQVLSAVGLFMIVLACCAFDEYTPTPSLITLIPTLGAVLVILFAREGALTHRILSFAPVVGIGLISYSAYLWHQPIFALLKYRFVDDLHNLTGIAAILGSVVLAYLSWKYVEAPFRNRSFMTRKAILTTSAAALLALAIFGGLVSMNTANALEAFRKNYYNVTQIESVTSADQFYNGQEDVVILWGDSYADAISYPLGEVLNEAGIGLKALIKHSCPSILGTLRNEPKRLGVHFAGDCKAHNEAQLSDIEALAHEGRARYVVMLSAYLWYLDGRNTDGAPILIDEDEPDLTAAQLIPQNLRTTADQLQALGLTPIIIMPYPIYGDLEKYLRRGEADITIPTQAADAASTLLMQGMQDNDFLAIDARGVLCGSNTDECAVFLNDGTQPYLWYDGSHLSRFGAEEIAEQVKAIVNATGLK